MVQVNSTCIHCSPECVNCILTPTQCTSCHPPDLLYLQTCSSTCPSGTFPNSELGQCITCTKPCQTCVNAYSCTSCIYGYILYQEPTKNQCVEGPSCPNSYYSSLKNGNPVCKFECDSSEYREPSSKTCSETCPVGYVHYSPTQTCLSDCPSPMWVD